MDSRQADDGSSIRRRRACLSCEQRFTTFERLEELPVMVMKRSGVREPFDQAKVISGVELAIKGRPLDPQVVVQLAGEVEEAVRLAGPETSSDFVGMAVLERLRELDVVAAVRFASVYKEFDDLADFERELDELTGTTRLTKNSAPKQH
ncbi:MAG: transcriptional repressor NrdR [Planctomycetales bacterium]|nr:transcriptional repressor NrdR [Planctomycetales bacterium]